MEISFVLNFLVALLSVLNPIANLSCFVSLTARKNQEDIKMIAKKAAIAIFFIMIISLFFGSKILTILGITLSAFEVAGGVVVFLIGLSMINGEFHKDDEQAKHHNPAIVPLAIPLLAGPGTISLIIVQSEQCNNLECYLALTAVILLVAIIIWFLFTSSHRISKLLDPAKLRLVTTLMGIVLMSISAQMIARGVKVLMS